MFKIAICSERKLVVGVLFILVYLFRWVEVSTRASFVLAFSLKNKGRLEKVIDKESSRHITHKLGN